MMVHSLMMPNIESESLDRRDVLRLQADAPKRWPANVCSRTGVARLAADSAGFHLVSGFAVFGETSRVHWVHRVR